MKKFKESKILKFPGSSVEAEKQVEAVLFAAEEPLDIETIKTRIKTKGNIPNILAALQKQYANRGINLICISNKWSFRTAENLSKLMSQQKNIEKKLSKAAKRIASICLSSSVMFGGKLTTLFFFNLFIYFL